MRVATYARYSSDQQRPASIADQQRICREFAAGLEHSDQRDAARQALRGFLEKIVIPRGDGLLQVVGNVGSMLAAAQGRARSRNSVGNVGCGGGI